LPRSTRGPANNPSTLPVSAEGVAVDEGWQDALAAILRAIEDLKAAVVGPGRGLAARPGSGILAADYLTPAELAVELHIKENYLAVWKREGFGPPRTRVRQLIVYRREAVLEWLRSLEENSVATGEDLRHRSDDRQRGRK
jgi:hypothetical protein